MRMRTRRCVCCSEPQPPEPRVGAACAWPGPRGAGSPGGGRGADPIHHREVRAGLRLPQQQQHRGHRDRPRNRAQAGECRRRGVVQGTLGSISPRFPGAAVGLGPSRAPRTGGAAPGAARGSLLYKVLRPLLPASYPSLHHGAGSRSPPRGFLTVRGPRPAPAASAAAADAPRAALAFGPGLPHRGQIGRAHV